MGATRRGIGEGVVTVGELAGMVRSALAGSLPSRVRVVGEVSNFVDRSHWFFSLKDDRAAVKCVCFASAARRVRFGVQDGIEVVVTGRVDFYEASGQVQLYVDRLEPVGQGALELRFRALCEELRGLGYFDVARKRALPVFCRRVAVVTSRTGAALQDVVDTARRRWAGCGVVLVDVRVQGESAVGEVARAIRGLSRQGRSLGVDAIILTRGGGSMEDLWAFNERVVADAVFECQLPVVAAIGHETDTTVAELVADLRCATPTQAAMAVVPDRVAYDEQIEQMERRLSLMVERQHASCAQRLMGLRKHPVFSRPGRVAELCGERVDRLADRLRSACVGCATRGSSVVDRSERRLAAMEPRGRLRSAVHQVDGARERLRAALVDRVAAMRLALERCERDLAGIEPRGRLRVALQRVEGAAGRLGRGFAGLVSRGQEHLRALERQLVVVGPRSVLGRGYSYTLTGTGALLRRADQVEVGDRLTTVLGEGRVESEVVRDGEASPKPVGTRSRRRREGDGTPGLFDER